MGGLRRRACPDNGSGCALKPGKEKVIDYLRRAHELEEELTADRRFLHRHPETGCDTPVTRDYIEKRLGDMGYEAVRTGPGLVAAAGHGSPVILLRADMDGLVMAEESGLPFASLNHGKAHCCGHDIHAAMLLGAARMLKENEANLKGTVKLMFQPGEETGEGAMAMVDGGVLEHPRPDAAMAFHVDAALALGRFHYSKGPAFCSNDIFEIEVSGKAGHGARPHQAIDAINASAHIITGLESLIARESIPVRTCVLTVCSIESSTRTSNVFPARVTMAGSIRTDHPEQRDLLVRRLVEVVKGIADSFQCTGKVVFRGSQEPLIVDGQAESEMRGYLEEVLGNEGTVEEPPVMKMGSEDFACVASRIPTAYFFIGGGPDRENGYFCSQHNSKVRYNEEMLPLGAAGYAHIADRWLENHSAANLP